MSGIVTENFYCGKQRVGDELSRGLALIFVGMAGIFWASSGVAVQDFFAHSTKTAIELTNIRMCTAGALLILIAARRKNFWLSLRLLNRHPRLWLDVAIYGVIGVMFMQFTYFQAISIGGAAATTVITYACPAMVVMWESFYNRRLPKRGEVIAVVLAMSGVFFIGDGRQPDKVARADLVRDMVFAKRRGVCIQRDFPEAPLCKKNRPVLFDGRGNVYRRVVNICAD